MEINQILKLLGLNATEEKIYLFLLESGVTEIYDIVHSTKVKRTTVYSALENLKQKKLINWVDKISHKEYFVENPKNIANILLEKEHQIHLRKHQLLEVLPELTSIYNAHINKPKIRIYEGEEAIKASFDEMLAELPRGSEILSFTNSEELNEDYIRDFILDYMERRAAKGISNRAIAEDYVPFVKEVQAQGKERLGNIILIDPQKYPCYDRINIYGDKVCIISFKERLVLIIESKAIAENHRTIFELAWLGAQKVGKLSPNPYILPGKNK